jgi:putative solute:sodium symporter small subunit
MLVEPHSLQHRFLIFDLMPDPSTSKNNPSSSQNVRSYWRKNLLVVGSLLFVWLVVGYGCSIYFIELLNRISIGKLGLGFWFAQQGSILVFVLLVWLYAVVMDRVDQQFQRGDD